MQPHIHNGLESCPSCSGKDTVLCGTCTHAPCGFRMCDHPLGSTCGEVLRSYLQEEHRVLHPGKPMPKHLLEVEKDDDEQGNEANDTDTLTNAVASVEITSASDRATFPGVALTRLQERQKHARAIRSLWATNWSTLYDRIDNTRTDPFRAYYTYEPKMYFLRVIQRHNSDIPDVTFLTGRLEEEEAVLGKRRFEVVVEDCEIQGARTDGVAREAMAGWEGAWENGDQKGRDFVVLWDGGAGAVMCTPRVRFNGEVWAGDEVDD